jgi:hypothetical protein
VKLTNKELRQIIKEELEGALDEQSNGEALKENRKVRFVSQQIIKLLQKHIHAFDSSDQISTFLKSLADSQEIKNFRSLDFDAPEKPKSRGTVKVDDPTME